MQTIRWAAAAVAMSALAACQTAPPPASCQLGNLTPEQLTASHLEDLEKLKGAGFEVYQVKENGTVVMAIPLPETICAPPAKPTLVLRNEAIIAITSRYQKPQRCSDGPPIEINSACIAPPLPSAPASSPPQP